MKTEPTRLRQITLGGGVEIDEIKTDLHAVTGWEDHNFLGGLRDFAVTFKPGVVLYPVRINNLKGPLQPLPDEWLQLELKQPGFIEARTRGFVRPAFNIFPLLVEVNPPANAPVVGYREAKLPAGVDRTFFRKLYVALDYTAQIENPFGYVSALNPALETVVISYPELVAHLDFRDNPTNPHAGVYVGNTLQVAGGIFGGNATDVRVQPELRTYVPLSRGVTFATRASMGFLWSSNYGKNWQNELTNSPAASAPGAPEIGRSSSTTCKSCTSAASSPAARRPTAAFPSSGSRPTGSCPFSTRAPPRSRSSSAAIPGQPGFNPKQATSCFLPVGGFTLWELQNEVRIDVSGPLSVELFCDMSDVSPNVGDIRLSHLHLSCGIGAAYGTPVGPIRLDLGYRVQPLQVLGYKDENAAFAADPLNGEQPTIFGLPLRDRDRHRAGVLMATTPHPRHGGSFGTVPVARMRRGGSRLGARLLRGAGKALAALVAFVLLIALGAVVHLNTTTARRLVATRVSALLGPMFRGKITLERIGHIGLLSGVTGVDARVDDSSGRPVLFARGVRVRLGTLALLRSVLLDKTGPMKVAFESVAIDDVDVRLDTDAQGNLALAGAFASAGPPSPPGGATRELRLSIDRIDLGHAWAHGEVAGAPPIDAELDTLRGSLLFTTEALDLDVARAHLLARRIANGTDAAGALQGHLRLPGVPGRDPDVRASWDRNGSPASPRASTPRSNPTSSTPPSTCPGRSRRISRKLWAGSTIDAPAKAHLTAHGPLAGFDVALQAAVGAAAVDGQGHVAWGADRRAKLTLRGRDLDVHAFAPSAPRSRLGLEAELTATMRANRALSGDAVVSFLGGPLGPMVFPRHPASLARPQPGPGAARPRRPRRRRAGRADAPDRGPRARGGRLARRLHARHPRRRPAETAAAGPWRRRRRRPDRLRRRRRVPPDGRRRGASARPRRRAGTTRVHAATVDILAHGSFAHPELSATVHAHGVQAGGKRFNLVVVTARGPVTAPHVTASIRGPDTPDLDAAADLHLQQGLDIAGVDIGLSRGTEQSRLTAQSIRLGGGTIAVDGARIEGLGHPLTATVTASRAAVGLQARTDGIDLARVARLLHLDRVVQGGTLTLDTDVRVERGAATGHLILDVAHVSAGNARDVTGHAEVTTTGPHDRSCAARPGARDRYPRGERSRASPSREASRSARAPGGTPPAPWTSICGPT